MKYYALTFLLFLVLTTHAQHKNFPTLVDDALINKDIQSDTNKDFTLVVFGGLHCGYSKHLINNIDALNQCNNLSIVLILDQPADSIRKYLPETLAKYPIYTNTVLNYAPSKSKDIFPQTVLFSNTEQLLYVKGVKENILIRIAEKVNCR